MAHLTKIMRFGAALSLLSLLGGTASFAETLDIAEFPSEVEGLAAVPGNAEVSLTWDAATDNNGVDGYYVYAGLSSVVKNGGSYTFPSIDAGNTTTFTVDNLSNGVTYYFSVTAYDEDGNESEYYSNEVEATPESSEIADYTAPTVKNAAAISGGLVEVTFSEPVELPSEANSAFSIISDAGDALQIVDAYLSDDPSTVFLVTAVQEAGMEYELTAGIGISDESGNPIESGTSDTAYFKGSGIEESAEAPVLEDNGDSDSFIIEEIDATEINELVLTFSEEVVNAATDSFTIQLEDDATELIEVLAVSIDANNESQVTLVTEEMEAGYDYVLTVDDSVFNISGDSISADDRSLDFTAATLEFVDIIAPEDISDLLAELSGENSVLLTWTESADTAGDLANYLLYKSMDGGISFEDAIKIVMSAEQYTVSNLTAGESYTFKVTAVDENGNESEGVLTTVALPESGPGLIALGFLSVLGAGVINRRKKSF